MSLSQHMDHVGHAAFPAVREVSLCNVDACKVKIPDFLNKSSWDINTLKIFFW